MPWERIKQTIFTNMVPRTFVSRNEDLSHVSSIVLSEEAALQEKDWHTVINHSQRYYMAWRPQEIHRQH